MYLLNPEWNKAASLIEKHGRFWTKTVEKHGRLAMEANQTNHLILAYPGDVIEVGYTELCGLLAEAGYTDAGHGPLGVMGVHGDRTLEIWVNGSHLFWKLTEGREPPFEGEGEFPPAGPIELAACPVCGGRAIAGQDPASGKWEAYCFCEKGMCLAYTRYRIKTTTRLHSILAWNDFTQRQRRMMGQP